MSSRRKPWLFPAILALLTVAAFLLSVKIGAVRMSWQEVRAGLFSGGQYRDIIIHLRLPRAILAYLVGASLALSGAILQGYFRNSLADPFILGVSSGASLGAVLSLEIGLTWTVFGFSSQSWLAFLTSLLLVATVYLISERRRLRQGESLLLTGIAAGAMASALTSFLLFRRADAYEQAVFWLLGSFSLSGWKEVWLIFPYFLLALIVSEYFATEMNLLALGDEVAQSLGCPVRATRRLFLFLATLLASFSVAVAGIIGFVGLIVPHSVRLIVGPDHRPLFFYSALTGGAMLVWCDLVARIAFTPSEIPIGVITAALGAPFFIYLLNWQRPKHS
ncbi:MAG TPA: iron ABC transporter permease [Candidatus Saccharicenans sp.]|nr:iron ABC transporter permease [Candidatus Saccharicenans sp.]